MTRTPLKSAIQCVAALLLLAAVSISAFEPPADEVAKKPSTYAPAKDLERQFGEIIERVNDSVSDEADYGTVQAKRMAKDASTIAALAFVLGNHDQQNKTKSSAGAIIKAAQQLTDDAEKYADAKAAVAKLEKAIAATGQPADATWSCVGDIEQLMKSVPLLTMSMRRAVRPTRFERTRDQAAALSAALAAVFQVSMFDDTYCVDDADQKAWIDFCIRARDAASSCNSALGRGDQEAAFEGLEPLSQACDECHERFRPKQ
mgnify:CR=1 FL=1